jgi:glycosyltransferase involved in cell wall biosynthesis
LLRAARGLVFVSGELAERFRRYGKPGIVVSNGVDLSRYPPLPAAAHPHPRAIFLGSPYPWNGIERLLALARALGDWQFDLVGHDVADLGSSVPPNVHCHGRLDRRDYMPLLSRADIAFGPLALYRKGLDEASPLKVREYLACGLASVIAHRDSDFSAQVPFLLRLPNAPTDGRDIADEVSRFGEQWKGRRVPRAEIHHLDVRQKEVRRIEFFDHVLRKRAG